MSYLKWFFRIGLAEVKKFYGKLNSAEQERKAKHSFNYVDVHKANSIGFDEFEVMYHHSMMVKQVRSACHNKLIDLS